MVFSAECVDKKDLLANEENVRRFREYVNKDFVLVSAKTGEGLDELIKAIKEVISEG